MRGELKTAVQETVGQRCGAPKTIMQPEPSGPGAGRPCSGTPWNPQAGLLHLLAPGPGIQPNPPRRGGNGALPQWGPPSLRRDARPLLSRWTQRCWSARVPPAPPHQPKGGPEQTGVKLPQGCPGERLPGSWHAPLCPARRGPRHCRRWSTGTGRGCETDRQTDREPEDTLGGNAADGPLAGRGRALWPQLHIWLRHRRALFLQRSPGQQGHGAQRSRTRCPEPWPSRPARPWQGAQL